MSDEARRILLTTGGLLVLAGVVLFFVPAANIWPWVLLFEAVGLGLAMPTLIAMSDAARQSRQP